MREIEEICIGDIQSFLWELVPNLGYRRPPLFRGQASAKWPVVPSLFREGVRRTEFSAWCDLESALLLSWKERSRGWLASEPTTELEWIATAEVAGVPTRFSTWTEKGLVALYFATEATGPGAEEDGVVWRLLPGDPGYLISHDYEQVPEEPRVFVPPRLTETLRAQRTCFLSHPLPREDAAPESLEDLFELGQDRLHLARIVIPAGAKADLRRSLVGMGVDSQAMWPGLPGIARQLREEIYHHTDSYEWVFPE